MKIVLVLRSGGDFDFNDVELLYHHIKKHNPKAEVICLNDKAPCDYKIGELKVIKMPYKWKGWWSKLNLFSPEMKKYRPFLYMDLDTIVLGEIPQPPDRFIGVKSFINKRFTSTMMWMPKECEVIDKIWQEQKRQENNNPKQRMDYLIREFVKPREYLQDYINLTSFKPNKRWLLKKPDASVVCFHGKPRIWEAANSVDWVKEYINEWKNAKILHKLWRRG